MDLSTIGILVCVTATLFIVLRPRSLYVLIKTLPRDLHLIWTLIKMAIAMAPMLFCNNTIPQLFRNTVRKYPKKIALHLEDQKWTFEQVDEFSNRVGNYFKKLGYKRQDSIALLMDSRPEYICLWLGLAKIGVTTAFINTNVMSKEALSHALKCGNSKSLIFGSRFKEVSNNAKAALPELKMFQFNDIPSDILSEATDLKLEFENGSPSSLDSDISAGKSEENLVYIYTSGTTGLPKASVIKNSRFFQASIFFGTSVGIRAEDVLYIPIPLYHALGGMCGISQCLVRGTTCVLKLKFSASSFWTDCEKYKCTVSQYIGEMARYVLLAHKNKEKPSYRLKKMFGNGMKPTTWHQFIEAFNVDQICEIYGSTEGTFALCNLDNTVGAVGYVPLFIDLFSPLTIIKCNSSGEPIRNKDGFCDVCDYNEAGLLIGKITNLLPLTKFDGYSDKESTKKKILRNVFKTGDIYFNTGDILMRDDLGYYYFKDRTGDTFRWKGENVSTNEVEDIISSFSNKEVAVYGVEIPGSEGKAGMAAIVDEQKTLDLNEFLQQCRATLPAYSIPVFLRILDKMPQTGTFKIQKVDLQKEGFNINLTKDDLYFLDPVKKQYIKMNSEVYSDIIECKVRI